MKKLAPIVLFTYNRLLETQQTIDALQKNNLAKESELFVFSDAPKDKHDKPKVEKVRAYLKNVTGFKNITIKESTINKGLANSVIDGVTEIINKYGQVIVLEDDLITSPNFLDFMNQSLDFYIESKEVISISGYTLHLPSLTDYTLDYYIGHRASSWGWGTWKNKWQDIDWEVSDYSDFKKDRKLRYCFFKIGSDMPAMLRRQMEGKIDSWAIRWCYHQFKNGLLTVYAAKSKVKHIGITEDATHAVGATRFNTPLDNTNKINFELHKDLVENKKIIREFKSKFSISTRIIDKILKTLKQ